MMAQRRVKRAKTQKSPKLHNPLVFIDTNILLDFYRVQTEAGLKLLQHLDNLHDKIICTYQVEMEFKKNRQKVILESMNALKDPGRISPPGFLSEAAAVSAIKKDLESARKRIKKLKDRVRKVLESPTTHDPVYKVVQRLFASTATTNLARDNNLRHTLRRLARRRFTLGYPPRKKNDTSIGDAINWEWIVQCAIAGKSDVVIVSRDLDYGVMIDSDFVVNDWLLREFRDRVSKQRKPVLTGRLSEALRLTAVSVSDEEKAAEENMVRTKRDEEDGAEPFSEKFIAEVLRYLDSATIRVSARGGLVKGEEGQPPSS